MLLISKILQITASEPGATKKSIVLLEILEMLQTLAVNLAPCHQGSQWGPTAPQAGPVSSGREFHCLLAQHFASHRAQPGEWWKSTSKAKGQWPHLLLVATFPGRLQLNMEVAGSHYDWFSLLKEFL